MTRSGVVIPPGAAALVMLVMVALVVAVAWLVVALRRARQDSARVLADAAGDLDALREELDALETRLLAQAELADSGIPGITVVDDREYVITELGERRARGPLAVVPMVPAPQFVDIVLRESLVRTASLAAGLRRALAPEVRNRVRFEMRREVKRARDQRKADQRQARREFHARQRNGLPAEASG